ncbi:glucose-6-phosphate isomerase [Aestuariirhabdus litorea]|uniref:glucose-6-phosphate isomerase n=1 Tax=Aestuariirhabdus litorea TaxID=2528527 RepID=UPI0024363DBE|nr:glucose-6-phosphate isomerase [Aestuariirhabdus litorea]
MKQYAAYPLLAQHKQRLTEQTLCDLFAQQPDRFQRYHRVAADWTLDFSKNRIDDSALAELLRLAEQTGIADKRDALFAGEPVNHTEQRPALHTALRSQDTQPLIVDGEDIRPLIHSTRQQIQRLCEQIHGGQWRGFSGQPIRDVVNIGIGGSFLGPKVVIEGLQPYRHPGIKVHFIANIDPADMQETLNRIDPATTLFIVASKSFGTQETICNARACRAWLQAAGVAEADLAKHFVAVTANVAKAVAFGIDARNVLPMWDWVGGRYSLWSAIGLPIALGVGYQHFCQLLDGARAMDEHFCEAPLTDNLPVLLGMLGIWYQNFWHARSHGLLCYSYYLRSLVDHIQQLDMESNGKSINRLGTVINYRSGAIIWGGEGCNGQHAYHQLLHQGNQFTPVDFILPLLSHHPEHQAQHRILVANALSQSQALMQGKSSGQISDELRAQGLDAAAIEALLPHKMVPGNRPSNTLVTDRLTPHSLGALLALYEHKVFVQAMVWGINPFDQWGVELGKQLSDTLLERLQDPGAPADQDSSSNGLIRLYHRALDV